MVETWWIDRSADKTNREVEVDYSGLMKTKLEKTVGEIIGAELVQKKKAMPRYNIREVPIQKEGYPCGCICGEYQRGDCPGEVWACLTYRKFKGE